MLSSIISKTTKQKEDVWEDDDDDNDNSDDDSNEDLALVTADRDYAAASSSSSLRATNTNLRNGNRRAPTYRGNNKKSKITFWILVAFCLLAMLPVVPLAKRRFYQQQRNSNISPATNSDNVNHKQPSNDITVWPSDDLVCAKTTYHMQFSQLYHQVAHRSDESESSFCTYPGTTASTSETDKNTQQEPIKQQKQDCTCRNPTVPNAIHSDLSHLAYLWNATFARNMGLIQEQEADMTKEPLDVVLFGDSITERWLGSSMLSRIPKENSSEYIQVYHELFNTAKSTKVETTKSSVRGLALGIAADRCPQLLYRLQNGELNFTSPPKVIWVLIGINDLYGDCAKETVLVGLIHIIQELQLYLRRQQPQKVKSWIVMNSIFPTFHWDSNKYLKLLQSIHWVNHRLECYIQGLDHVEFFNGTSLFLRPKPSHVVTNNNDAASNIIIDESLMHDFLHPSPRGQRLWGEAIVKKVLELTKQQATR